jgi:beta-lactamase regulating signal transducer with metallopeptidase domain
MITHNLITAIGQALFESCIQAMLIYIALQVFLKLFPMLSAKYRYLANYTALTAICVWFLVTIAKTYIQTIEVVAFIPAAYYPGEPQASVAPSMLDQAKHLINQYAVYIAGLYMLGLVIHIIGLVKGLFHVGRIRNKKNLRLSPVWTQSAAALRNKLSLLKNIPVYISDHVTVPLTIGHIKPIIIFPLALINNLDLAQVESILLHELAHIKRHDYLFNIIQSIMETILCFNPFSWLIGKAIRTEREYCCDDMVTGNVDNSYNYAQALFLIAQQNSYAASLTMASSGESKYPLLNRIKRLNHMKTDHQLHKQHLAIIVTITVISILLIWAVPQYTEAKNNKAAKAKTIVNPIPGLDAMVMKTSSNHANTLAKPRRRTITILPDSLRPANDTSKLKKKYKIVMEDDKGNKKEYNSVNELSPSERDDFYMSQLKPEDRERIDSLKKRFSSPEWKKEMEAITDNAKAMSKKFSSPEWKKQQEQMVAQATAMTKQFKSAEWKQHEKKMVEQAIAMAKRFDTPEWKEQHQQWEKQAQEIAKQFDSPEWKEQQEEMTKKAIEMSKQFNSPEFKKQMKDLVKNSVEIAKQFSGAETKKQQAELEKQMADLRKQQDELKKELLKAQKKNKKAVQDTIK